MLLFSYSSSSSVKPICGTSGITVQSVFPCFTTTIQGVITGVKLQLIVNAFPQAEDMWQTSGTQLSIIDGSDVSKYLGFGRKYISIPVSYSLKRT